MSKKVSVIHKESVIYPLLGNYLLGKSKIESVIYPLFINPALNKFYPLRHKYRLSQKNVYTL